MGAFDLELLGSLCYFRCEQSRTQHPLRLTQSTHLCFNPSLSSQTKRVKMRVSWEGNTFARLFVLPFLFVCFLLHMRFLCFHGTPEMQSLSCLRISEMCGMAGHRLPTYAGFWFKLWWKLRSKGWDGEVECALIFPF